MHVQKVTLDLLLFFLKLNLSTNYQFLFSKSSAILFISSYCLDSFLICWCSCSSVMDAELFFFTDSVLVLIPSLVVLRIALINLAYLFS